MHLSSILPPLKPPRTSSHSTHSHLRFAGIRVVEHSHIVVGPAYGMMLANLGTEVIKIEPLVGDNTRHLLDSGAGVFGMFNRNKKSIALDL